MKTNKILWIIATTLAGIAVVVWVIAAVKMFGDNIEKMPAETAITTAVTVTETTKETSETAAEITAGTTATTAETTETASEVTAPLGVVSPIDRINVDPLPEGAVYRARMWSQITIESENWTCYFSGYELSEFEGTLEEIAAKNIAYINDIHDWQNYDFITEEPVKTTIAGFDAIVYDSELYSNYGAEPNHIEHNRNIYFLSKTGVFEFDFKCHPDVFEASETDWDYIISHVKIDDELQFADVTTVSCEVTITI
jgi:hypothetical protein